MPHRRQIRDRASRSVRLFLLQPEAIMILLMCCLLASVSPAQARSAFVVWVTDGDTVTVIDDGFHIERIRVYGIDCPESNQPYGFSARMKTAWEVWGRPVTLQIKDRDRYGRLVARIHRKGTELSAALLASGLAWVYDRYCRDPVCTQWTKLERQAAEQNKGLWSAPDPIPPWRWRRGVRPDGGWRWW